MAEPTPQQKVSRYIVIESPPRMRASVTVMEKGQTHAPGGAPTLHLRRRDYPEKFFDGPVEIEITVRRVPLGPDNFEQETTA